MNAYSHINKKDFHRRFTGERPTLEMDQQFLVCESLSRYEFAKSYCTCKKVLDIGCGEGFGTVRLADSAQNATGVDYYEKAIDYANNNFRRPNLKFIRADCMELSFRDDIFDVITAFEVIEHLYDPKRFLAETVRVLKDNGIMILSSMQKHYGRSSGNPFHVIEYSMKELQHLLSGYYKDIELFGSCCVRKMNPVQRFIMNIDSYHILRKIRHKFQMRAISLIERRIGTTPPEEVSEKDFQITKENVSKAAVTIAICRDKCMPLKR